MSDLSEFNFNEILSGIKPSIVVPRLAEITTLSPDKKLRHISSIMVREMVKRYNDDKSHVVSRVILHDGKATEVRFFDVEPLISGVWPAISLMILQLSYGEQTMLIDAIYPKALQFTAKAFAATFTETSNGNVTGNKPLEIKTDKEISKKLDSANAGIAMILAILSDGGFKIMHPDKVGVQLSNMETLVEEEQAKNNYANATNRAKSAMEFRDR